MSVAFVLGGGGRWGAVEVGMLSALVDAGIEADMVVGTSIGAMNGAMFAADPTPEGLVRLEDAWHDLVADDVLVPRRRDQIRNVVRLESSIVDHGPLRDWLEARLPVSDFGDLVVDFSCVAASIERAAEHWFSVGALVPALLASSSIPGLFPPVEIDGEHFYDGGLVNSVPISRALEQGATTIFVLQVGRVEQQLTVPTRWYEAGLVALEIARRHRFATVNDGLPDHVDLHLLPSGHTLAPDDRRQLKWSDFGSTDELIDGARSATAEYLRERSLR